ncbi:MULTISPECIES: helix-turn-helix domain-containing protein [unclassified Salinivibrio]|uniref:helix-turn-helix domain-containing protein n=1 Tax=unclassified Salinivibrio TaxID=2636825 RepID=UPI0009870396|nr:MULTISPECIES: helix-turn-helix transcriptional regulator [unclassified Salinivibrio]OOF14070.1 transcriptional regulator [Salinivibrio sp. PR919]OOF15100.1 transcriptional regulator [Salinivibrio sp. PR932]
MVISTASMAQRIREAREFSKITQVDMAKRLNVARQTYLDVESGKTDPKILALITIAEITGRPFNWFIYGETDERDIAFSHRDDLAALTSLLSQLPQVARQTVMDNALSIAEYLVSLSPDKRA